MFSLHPQLAKDCAFVADLAVCRVLLMRHAQFPWLILVPMREGVREIYELSEDDYTTAMKELRQVAQKLQHFTRADKMNVAALGNMVPQLHFHVIARFMVDAAWPQPVWNSGVTNVEYTDEKLAILIDDLQRLIG